MARRRPAAARDAERGSLTGLRVIELADEQAEYCGLLLAGLGAEVVKVEPPGGSPTRRIGPFLDDRPDPEGSLHFWHHNRGKRSLVLALDGEADAGRLRELVARSDVFLHSLEQPDVERLGLGPDALLAANPGLVVARMSAFGESGPWSGHRGSDLVHLALGGVVMNCGYDPAPDGHYDLPPVAPQLWHAYQIAGDQLAIGILAALVHRLRTGEGQYVSCAIHEAVSKNTEIDLMNWVMRRIPLHRQTCRHSRETGSRVPSIAHTKDGRWVMAHYTNDPREHSQLVGFLDRHGMAADLSAEAAPASAASGQPAARSGLDNNSEERAHKMEVIQRFVRAYTYREVPWLEAQEAGQLWAPLRKPHENALDEHWLLRGSFADLEHPEMGRSFRYAVSKWISSESPWLKGRRAPRLGEDQHLLDGVAGSRQPAPRAAGGSPAAAPAGRSRQGRPFALGHVRILDFTWFLASAGGTRFLSALGAECIKVEWKARPDTRVAARAPVGGREARDRATGPLPGVDDPQLSGHYHHINAGKRGLSLNVKHPEGLEIARRLVAISDVVAEGFSPGVMEGWGLGYAQLRAIRPDIVYAQQSGMGEAGLYGRFRSIGPIAASLSGLSEMSGLPEPAMPAGWGYSYLDWIGAYSFALAILTALYHRERTGRGQHVDASQCETGLFQTGVPVLDWSANGREWARYGNRSPYKQAAPHGIYPCAGEDRWLAIACFGEPEWAALATVAERPDWRTDERFATLAARLANQDELDEAVAGWTARLEAYEAMARLQRAGVAAGVCQTAEDRCDRDPQLAALGWLTEVTGSKIGRWPVGEIPFDMSRTPPFIGGSIDRGAPLYGEDNEYVLGELLGFSSAKIERLAEEGAV